MHGLKDFDCSLGAIGGHPRTGAALRPRLPGNTCTEELVGMFEETGVDTGLDLQKRLAVGARAEQVLGRPLRSNYLRAGPVPHRGVKYDKQGGLVGAQAETETAPLTSPPQAPAVRA